MSDGFNSQFVSAQDGLKLHVRNYGPRAASGLAVVCLPGLTRNSADFEGIAVFPRAVLIDSDELAAAMRESMGGSPVCVLRGHGITTTGATVEQAVGRARRTGEVTHRVVHRIEGETGVGVDHMLADQGHGLGVRDGVTRVEQKVAEVPDNRVGWRIGTGNVVWRAGTIRLRRPRPCVVGEVGYRPLPRQ